MSLLGKYPCDNITAPTYLSFSTAASSILITIVASVGNSLVVLAVFLNPNRDLRTPFNYFVANLSIADLIVGLITGPLSTVYHIFEGVGMLKQRFKDPVHITFFISWTASLLSLTALAFDRYLAITYPLMYRTKLNPMRALLISLMVWIVSILFPMIYFVVGFNKFRFIFANTAVAVTFAVLIYERQDFQVFAIPSSAVGRLARQYRGELGQETSDEMGEENNKNPGHCASAIFSVLPACLHLHIHHKLLHKLRLCVYSLGQRHSDSYGNGQFRRKSICVRLAIGKFSKGF